MAPEIHPSLALSTVRRETWQELEIFRYPYCYPFVGLNAGQRRAMDKKGGNLLSWSLLWGLWRRPDVRLFHVHALKRLGGARYSRRRGCEVNRLWRPCMVGCLMCRRRSWRS